MATTRSSITRLLRAAISNTTTTALLHTHRNFHHHFHPFKPTSPLSFLRPHPSSPIVPNPQFFSTSRSVTPRATKSKLFGTIASSCMSFLKFELSFHINIILICGFSLMMLSKFLKSLGGETGTKFKGSLPDMFRNGHSVVVEGCFKLIIQDNRITGFKYYFSATEALTKPDQLANAMQRNKYILAEKLNVANQKQNVAVEEPEVVLLIRWGDKILSDVPNPPKYKSCPDGLELEGRVNQSVAFSIIAKMLIPVLLRDGLVDAEGLLDALREGRSVVVEKSVEPFGHVIKEEDKSGKSVAVKIWGLERHISAEVLGIEEAAAAAAAGGGGIEE